VRLEVSGARRPRVAEQLQAAQFARLEVIGATRLVRGGVRKECTPMQTGEK